MDNRRSPPTIFRVVQAEGNDVRMFGQNSMHSLAQLPRAFSVNDPHLKKPTLPTSGQVIRYQLAHLTWVERVQIQYPINR